MANRTATAADWRALNPIVPNGDVGIETDTNFSKIGDGLRTWLLLPYSTAPGAAGDASAANQVAQIAKLDSIAGMAIPAHDYIGLTNTGANLTQVVYRTGGAAGAVVATLTLAYTGGVLNSITRS